MLQAVARTFSISLRTAAYTSCSILVRKCSSSGILYLGSTKCIRRRNPLLLTKLNAKSSRASISMMSLVIPAARGSSASKGRPRLNAALMLDWCRGRLRRSARDFFSFYSSPLSISFDLSSSYSGLCIRSRWCHIFVVVKFAVFSLPLGTFSSHSVHVVRLFMTGFSLKYCYTTDLGLRDILLIVLVDYYTTNGCRSLCTSKC